MWDFGFVPSTDISYCGSDVCFAPAETKLPLVDESTLQISRPRLQNGLHNGYGVILEAFSFSKH